MGTGSQTSRFILRHSTPERIPITGQFSSNVEVALPNILDSETLRECQTRVRELHVADLADPYKAFDIAKVVETCQTLNVSKTARILDLGAYGSPVPLVLHNLGYEEICGIDLNPGVFDMPLHTSIHYHVADALVTHYPDSFYDVCLALSLIERLTGSFDDFFREAARILNDNGLLLVTTNLGSKPGLTRRVGQGGPRWRAFSTRDISRIVRTAENRGFSLVGELPNLSQDRFLNADDRGYTVVFLALRLAKQYNRREGRVAVLCPSLAVPRDGIAEYARTLAERLRAELCGDETEIPQNVDTVLVETYTTQFNRVKQFHFDARWRWFVDCHGLNSDMIVWFNGHRNVTPIVRSSYLVMLEQAEIPNKALNRYIRHVPPVAAPLVPPFRWVARRLIEARSPKLRNYVVAPHILYSTPSDESQKRSTSELCLGSFGFAFRFKNLDKIIDLGRKLGIGVVILASIADSTPEVHRETSLVAEQLEKLRSDNVRVLTGFFDKQEILRELSKCSHILMAQKDMREASGTIRFAYQVGLPIVALDSLQARDAGCLRVSSLDDITIPYLESTRNSTLKIEDGLPYYRAILSV